MKREDSGHWILHFIKKKQKKEEIKVILIFSNCAHVYLCDPLSISLFLSLAHKQIHADPAGHGGV